MYMQKSSLDVGGAERMKVPFFSSKALVKKKEKEKGRFSRDICI